MNITTLNNFIDTVEKLSLIPKKGLCNTLLQPAILAAYERLQSISPEKITDEIRRATPDATKVQEAFDYFKKKLNMIDIPDFDVSRVSLVYQGEACKKEACKMWECLLEKCAEVKRCLYEYADSEDLQNNLPKNNFLSPPFYREDEAVWLVEMAEKKEFSIPKELDTEEARVLLKKAIDCGFCDDNYKWLKSKSLLAYFVENACENLKLNKGEYDGRDKISWKPFEILFNIKGLACAKRDYQKTGTLPRGSSDVDELFK